MEQPTGSEIQASIESLPKTAEEALRVIIPPEAILEGINPDFIYRLDTRTMQFSGPLAVHTHNHQIGYIEAELVSAEFRKRITPEAKEGMLSAYFVYRQKNAHDTIRYGFWQDEDTTHRLVQAVQALGIELDI